MSRDKRRKVETEAHKVETAAPVVEAATPVVEAATPVTETAAPVVEAATPVTETAAPVVEAAPEVATFRGTLPGVPAVTLERLRAMVRSITKVMPVQWFYMAATEREFRSGAHYQYRVAVLDGIGTEPIPGRGFPARTLAFFGIVLDASGNVDTARSACFIPSGAKKKSGPWVAPLVFLDSARSMVGDDATAGNGRGAQHCASTDGARITAHAGPTLHWEPTKRGGCYAMTAIVDADFRPLV